VYTVERLNFKFAMSHIGGQSSCHTVSLLATWCVEELCPPYKFCLVKKAMSDPGSVDDFLQYTFFNGSLWRKKLIGSRKNTMPKYTRKIYEEVL